MPIGGPKAHAKLVNRLPVSYSSASNLDSRRKEPLRTWRITSGTETDAGFQWSRSPESLSEFSAFFAIPIPKFSLGSRESIRNKEHSVSCISLWRLRTSALRLFSVHKTKERNGACLRLYVHWRVAPTTRSQDELKPQRAAISPWPHRCFLSTLIRDRCSVRIDPACVPRSG